MTADSTASAACVARLCQKHPLCRLRYQLDVGGGPHYSDCDTNSRGGFGDGFPCDCTCEADVRALHAENAALREELWRQWRENHSEHCDFTWPHPERSNCEWPVPEVLRDEAPR